MSIAATSTKTDPWREAWYKDNKTVIARGTTREGETFSILAPPPDDVVAEWEKDPAYVAYMEEARKQAAADAATNFESRKQAFQNGYIGFIGKDETIHLNMGARGRNTLTAEQLAYFKEKYGDVNKLDYDTKLRMYAELAELDVIDGRLAHDEINRAQFQMIRDEDTEGMLPLSSDDIEKYLALLYERYGMLQKDLHALRGQAHHDLLQEQCQTCTAEGIAKLHGVLSSIFEK